MSQEKSGPSRGNGKKKRGPSQKPEGRCNPPLWRKKSQPIRVKGSLGKKPGANCLPPKKQRMGKKRSAGWAKESQSGKKPGAKPGPPASAMRKSTCLLRQ